MKKHEPMMTEEERNRFAWDSLVTNVRMTHHINASWRLTLRTVADTSSSEGVDKRIQRFFNELYDQIMLEKEIGLESTYKRNESLSITDRDKYAWELIVGRTIVKGKINIVCFGDVKTAFNTTNDMIKTLKFIEEVKMELMKRAAN